MVFKFSQPFSNLETLLKSPYNVITVDGSFVTEYFKVHTNSVLQVFYFKNYITQIYIYLFGSQRTLTKMSTFCNMPIE